VSLPAGWTPEQFAQASASEIAAGRLPLSAQWRIAQQRQAAERGDTAFTSGLSVGEFTALRSIGFSPVGQVMGSAVYHIGWTTGCGYMGGLFGMGGPAPVVDVPGVRHLMEQARHRALHRLHQECAGLGGDGVVGVQLTVGPFYGNGLEFVATGTAVRADGDRRPPHPFTSDLSGQDFVKLVRGGWLPVALVMGLGVALRHDDWLQRTQQSSWYNQELVGLTQLVTAARTSARAGLDADVRRHGATGVVLRDMVVQIREVRCGTGNNERRDHFAEALHFGTAITPLPARDKDPATDAAPLPMLRLDPSQRRWIA
jgi:uncharacterized protein YbjQ (UPF0145 family)